MPLPVSAAGPAALRAQAARLRAFAADGTDLPAIHDIAHSWPSPAPAWHTGPSSSPTTGTPCSPASTRSPPTAPTPPSSPAPPDTAAWPCCSPARAPSAPARDATCTRRSPCSPTPSTPSAPASTRTSTTRCAR
ncbi:hypothetical protein ACFQ60_10555 [Streptomyces zhihengii]